MESVFDRFAKAYAKGDGYGLSQTLSPALPEEYLQAIWKSCNSHSVKDSIRRHIQRCDFGRPGALSKDEVAGWTEVYSAFWKAIGELLAVQAGPSGAGKVSISPCHHGATSAHCLN